MYTAFSGMQYILFILHCIYQVGNTQLNDLISLKSLLINFQ